MFQYAAAKACALGCGGQLKISICDLQEHQLPFKASYTEEERLGFLAGSLGVFDMPLSLASEDEVYGLRGWGAPSFLGRCIRKAKRSMHLLPRSYYVEPHSFAFDPSVLSIHHDVYLDGLFINPKYFGAIHDDLRQDFTFSTPMAGENKKIAEEIQACNSVSLHVRIGDYENGDTIVQKVYPVYGRPYYERAVAAIAAKVNDPKYYVFSDNPDWAKKNLSFIKNCTFVSHNPIDKGYEDMRLMSLCKHNIITNSTFSWWGAWLNDNPEKVVVVPRRWFFGLDNSDLLLDGWHVIDAAC